VTTTWNDLYQELETASGVKVSEETALKMSAVWSAVKLLGESVAQLPLQVYKRTDGGKQVDKVHPVYRLVHEAPNEFQAKFTFVQTLMNSILLWGNGYARITRDAMERPVALTILHPDSVEVVVKTKLWYRVEGATNLIPSRNMIHVLGFSLDGIKGKSPIEVARDNIGLGLAAEAYGAYFFKNGANNSGVLQVPASLTDEQYKRLKNAFVERNAGLKNANKPMVLEGGMTWKEISIPQDQAQFIQTREFQLNDIARIYNVPPHMIGDLSRSTNNNIEHQSIGFVQYSLMPWVKRIEEEFTRKLFYEDEKPEYFIEANVEGLLRGDSKSRAEFYRTLWNIGAIAQNEIRSLENWNPADNEYASELFVPVNMIPLKNITDAQSQNNQPAGGIAPGVDNP
jgi:HK97 family phage portal protein